MIKHPYKLWQLLQLHLQPRQPAQFSDRGAAARRVPFEVQNIFSDWSSFLELLSYFNIMEIQKSPRHSREKGFFYEARNGRAVDEALGR